jgi:predicted N-formylglutamate amidohydrolase
MFRDRFAPSAIEPIVVSLEKDEPTLMATIAAVDAPSHRVVSGSATRGLVILCDHASNHIPQEYGTLGLDPAQLKRHIAYDIGAEAVVTRLARMLEAPAVLSRFSRLLIDPNRGDDDPTLIMRLSDGAVVPGNRHLDADERRRRTDRFWRPYHAAITGVIDRCEAAGTPPAIVSIHSFTESWKGVPRPWHVGILWEGDRRLAVPLLEAFRAESGLIVGENQPYPGSYEGDCCWQHGVKRELPWAIVEIRQDLIRDEAGQIRWAERLARIIESLAPRPDLHLDGRPLRGHHSYGDSAMPLTDRFGEKTETELEAAAFRRLVEHLRQRSDVQNIDMMNLAGFCRNCLSNWYQEAAAKQGKPISKDEAREIIYGMPYKEWQSKHQTEASPEKLTAFEANRPKDH